MSTGPRPRFERAVMAELVGGEHDGRQMTIPAGPDGLPDTWTIRMPITPPIGLDDVPPAADRPEIPHALYICDQSHPGRDGVWRYHRTS